MVAYGVQAEARPVAAALRQRAPSDWIVCFRVELSEPIGRAGWLACSPAFASARLWAKLSTE